MIDRWCYKFFAFIDDSFNALERVCNEGYKAITNLFTKKEEENKSKYLFKNLKQEVETGANGTQEYVIKKGINKGKIAKMKISENTNVGLPLRNLIGLISAIVVGAWFAFGVIERLNNLETRNKLFEQDLLEASTQKPIDQEQFMLLEDLYKTVEKLQSTQEMNMTNKVNIEFHTKQIEKLLSDVEKLKDKQREFANGNH